MDNIEGKVVIVTGAANGIGYTTAKAFACKGARLVLADLDKEAGNQAAKEIRREGGEAIFCETDVSRTQDVKRLVDATVDAYGKLDYAFNNAGIAMDFAPVHEASEESWDRVIDVNLKGVWACMKYEISQMLKNGGGAIVNMSSIHGLSAMKRHYSYVASKHGVIGLTRCAALDYGEKGIRINAICPGVVETQLIQDGKDLFENDDHLLGIFNGLVNEHQIGRIGKPEEVAETVMFLCAGPMFLTGSCLVIDGAALCH